jgi:hypothetical protein
MKTLHFMGGSHFMGVASSKPRDNVNVSIVDCLRNAFRTQYECLDAGFQLLSIVGQRSTKLQVQPGRCVAERVIKHRVPAIGEYLVWLMDDATSRIAIANHEASQLDRRASPI